MKRIIITGAGGSGAISFARALRETDEDIFTIGVDCNKYKLNRAVADERILIPPVEDDGYIDVLKDVIKQFNIDFLHVQTTAETLAISAARNKLRCRTFLPHHETLLTCADKYRCFQIWQNAGIQVPNTIWINNDDDLKKSFDCLGPRIWLRSQNGSSGIGSLPTSNIEQARLWIDRFEGWGKFVAAVCLEKRTVTFESIWKNGELVVGQQRERLYWEYSNRVQSGVTGVTGTSLSVDFPEVTEIALKAIRLIEPNPNGLLGVDFTYDKNGVANPTEINAGRFMSTHGFFTSAGINYPLIMVKCVFDEAIPEIAKKINPLPVGLTWIRGMDSHPILKNMTEIDKLENDLASRIASLKNAKYMTKKS